MVERKQSIIDRGFLPPILFKKKTQVIEFKKVNKRNKSKKEPNPEKERRKEKHRRYVAIYEKQLDTAKSPWQILETS